MSGQDVQVVSRYRCPYCYEPVSGRNRKDGTCDTCKHSRDLFPVNYKRYPKKKDDEEDDLDYYGGFEDDDAEYAANRSRNRRK